MSKQGCEIGIVGLGTMGRNLVLNFADRGFSVAVYNRTTRRPGNSWPGRWAPGISGPATT